MTYTESMAEGYDVNYYVSRNSSQQNVIGNVTFNGSWNNPVNPTVPEATIKVNKVDEDGKHIIGADFVLYDDHYGSDIGDCIKDSWTTDGSVHTCTGLETGMKFIIREENAPDGYEKAPDTTFYVDDNCEIQMIEYGNATFVNGLFTIVDTAIQEYGVSILKTDDSGNALEGAILQLLNGDSVIDEWTSDSTAHEIADLEQNVEYTITEINAPKGYLKGDDIKFTIDESHNIITNAEIDDGAIMFKNRKTSVKITKMDITHNTPLAGARLKVLLNIESIHEFILDEWTSTTDTHIIEGLEIGTEYVIHEVAAPDGYSIANDIIFVINEDGSVTTSANITSDGTILVEDSYLTVYAVKNDIESGEILTGAYLQVIDSDNKVVDEWTSTADKHLISGLRADMEYIIREVSAPNGYVKGSDVTFSVNNDNIVTTDRTLMDGNTIVIGNKQTEMTVTKVDITTNEEIEGATLQILDGNDIIEKWVIATEKHIIKGLATDTEYIIREIIAPNAYVYADDTHFSIDEKGNVIVHGDIVEDNNVIVNNKPTEIKIIKTDISSGDAVEGAFLQVFTKDGALLEDEWSSTTEPHMINGLNVDTEYVLHEMTAPFGYVLSDDLKFTIRRDGTIRTTGSTNGDDTIALNNTKTRIAISKIDITNGEELAGATIQIIDGNDVVAEWVSTDEPHIIEGLGTNVDYIIRETIAPAEYIPSPSIPPPFAEVSMKVAYRER